MINETIQITQEQFLKVHYSNTVPNLIAVYVITIFSVLFIGLKMVKHDRKKFYTIWIYSAVISALFLGFLILFPNTTSSILNYFGGLLKN